MHGIPQPTFEQLLVDVAAGRIHLGDLPRSTRRAVVRVGRRDPLIVAVDAMGPQGVAMRTARLAAADRRRAEKAARRAEQ